MMLKVGEVCSFVYDGGTRSGKRRTVYVQSADGSLLQCWDFNVGAIRNYYSSLIRGIEEVQHTNVDLTQLPGGYNNGVTLVKAYNGLGKLAYFDRDNSRVVSIELPKQHPTLKQAISHDGGLHIRYGNNVVTLYISRSNNACELISICDKVSPSATLDDIIRALEELRDNA
jgi:hypothetical protein